MQPDTRKKTFYEKIPLHEKVLVAAYFEYGHVTALCFSLCVCMHGLYATAHVF